MDIVKTLNGLIADVDNGDIDTLAELQRELIYLRSELEQLTLTDVSDLCCASCGYQMKFDNGEDKWGCTKCGHTSQHYR